MQNSIDELNEFNLENFKKAVHLLYHGENRDLKKKADQYLCEFEKKNEAWDIAIQVLNIKSLDEEVYYNASQIIKKKIRFDFGNYAEIDIFKNLSNFLTEKIIEFKDHKLYLLSNFCKCFALLTIFAHSLYPDIIKNLCSRLYNKDIKNLMALLLIFNYLAENENDSDIVVDESYRESYLKFIGSISEDVIIFIDYLIKIITDTEYKKEIIKNDANMVNFFRIMNRNIVETFKNWIDIGLSSQTLAKLPNEYIGLINFIFKIDNENIEIYSECISLLLRLPLQDQQLSNLGLIILNKVTSFKTNVYKAIEIKDEEEIKFFIDIFVNLCETNMEEIIKENRSDLLQIIVDLCKNCPADRIGFVCDFWQKFNYFLSDNQINIQQIIEKYGTLFKEVMSAMLILIKYDDNVFLELNNTKSRKLKDIHSFKQTQSYRKVIKIFFQDSSAFFSFFYIYNTILLPNFYKSVEEIKHNMNSITSWAEMEAEIFLFQSICRNIDKNGDLSFLDAFFETIFEIPENLIQIKRTATDVIDEIGSILSLKPNILMKAFNYLLIGTENPLLIKYCSISLKNLLSDNKKILCNNKSDLLKIYDEKVKIKALENETYQRILEGIVEVLCIGENESEITSSLVHVLSSWVIMLSQAKEKFVNLEDISSDEMNSLCKIVEIVKIIVRSAYESLSIKNVSILSKIFIELWPMIRFLMHRFNSNSTIIEQLTQIIKHFMRGMGSEFKQYLEDYLNLILEGYKINPISSYLYAFEIIATVFVNDATTESLLKIMLKELCLQTFNYYLTTVEEFENNPHLTEDFFGLIYRIVRLNPCIIIDFELFENLIYVCISNIGISHLETVKNIIFFLQKIISFHEIQKMKNMDEKFLGNYNEKVCSVIKKLGESLVTKIFNYIITVPPGMIFEHLKDLIIYLIQNYPKECEIWFEKNLRELPADCLTNTEKEKFIKTIIDFNEGLMDNILDNFYRRCLSRLYRQT